MSLVQSSAAPGAGETEGRAQPVTGRRPAAFSTSVFWAAAAVAAAAAVGPLLAEFGRRTWAAEHYRFGPLLLVALAAVGWRRARSVAPSPPRLGPRLALWAGTVSAGAAAVVFFSPFLSVLTLQLLVLAGVYEYGGAALLRREAGPWAAAWLAVPPPFDLDRAMMGSLQRASTWFASGLMDVGGLRHLADGVVIRLPARSYFVDEACSGVHSLFAAMAFAAVFSAATDRGMLRAALLLGASVFWVVVGNAARIAAVVVLSSEYRLPVTAGWGHELVGIAAFAAVVGLVVSTARLCLFLFPPPEAEPEADRRPAAATVAAPPLGGRGVGVSAAVCAASAALAVGALTLPLAAQPRWQSNPLPADEAAARSSEPLLPGEWDGWRRERFETRHISAGDLEGGFSRVWTYRKGRLFAAVSLDGPYDGWHDLAECYRGLGYRVEEIEDSVGAGGAPETRLGLTKDPGRHGLAFFSAYAESGGSVGPPRAARQGPLTSRVATALQRRFGSPAEAPRGRVFQVQVFSESGLAYPDTERAELRRLFHEMRRRIAERIATGRAEGPI